MFIWLTDSRKMYLKLIKWIKSVGNKYPFKLTVKAPQPWINTADKLMTSTGADFLKKF